MVGEGSGLAVKCLLSASIAVLGFAAVNVFPLYSVWATPTQSSNSAPASNSAANSNFAEAESGFANGTPISLPESYATDVATRIGQVWFPPSRSEYKKVGIQFRLHRDGAVSKVEIVQSAGCKMADRAAIGAVNNAAPFPPLPNGTPDPIMVKFKLDRAHKSHAGTAEFCKI